MKNNDDIPTTDMTEIKQLINRVKWSELDQGDAQLIEKLLNIRVLAAMCAAWRIWFLPMLHCRKDTAHNNNGNAL
jgi:hypothetical protein